MGKGWTTEASLASDASEVDAWFSIGSISSTQVWS